MDVPENTAKTLYRVVLHKAQCRVLLTEIRVTEHHQTHISGITPAGQDVTIRCDELDNWYPTIDEAIRVQIMELTNRKVSLDPKAEEEHTAIDRMIYTARSLYNVVHELNNGEKTE
jgi:hypothetical protein